MKTAINIKADRAVKENAQRVASELGLSLSAIINAYLKQLVRNRTVYFSSLPHMSPELEALIGKVEKDIQEKRNVSRTLASPEEVSQYLDAL